MTVFTPEDDSPLWKAFCELVDKASGPSHGPTEDELAFAVIDRLLHEKSSRAGALIMLLARHAYGPMSGLLHRHFGGDEQRVTKAKIIIGWPVVAEASPVMQMATNLVVTSGNQMSREQVDDLLQILEEGWKSYPHRYIQLLNCLVCLVAALREGTVSIGPALESAP